MKAENSGNVIRFSEPVKAALDAGAAVVALESTIITHGMPWPANHDTAMAVEAEVSKVGAVPATIAVFDGVINVGLSEVQLEKLAKMDNVMKLSRADLAFALASGRAGSTTVAATMMAARLAGIEVFATGGIGGVHKGAEKDFDISADLEELSRTSTIVVCAGAKAILDLPKTLEVLETKGVPVVGYGVDELPAFWSRHSGLKAPLRLDDPEGIATLWQVRKAIGQEGGVLIANPVPKADEISARDMQKHIDQAVAEAMRKGIKGKDMTPWLLARVVELTKGRSLDTNIALIRNNARLAGQIAVALVNAPQLRTDLDYESMT